MKRILFFIIAELLLFCSVNVYATGGADSDVSQASLLMPYKDISRKPRALNKMRLQAKNLSDAEKSVIKKYVFGAVRGEDTYLLINCYLRDTLEFYIPKKKLQNP